MPIHWNRDTQIDELQVHRDGTIQLFTTWASQGALWIEVASMQQVIGDAGRMCQVGPDVLVSLGPSRVAPDSGRLDAHLDRIVIRIRDHTIDQVEAAIDEPYPQRTDAAGIAGPDYAKLADELPF